jgi:hypothetical protein
MMVIWLYLVLFVFPTRNDEMIDRVPVDLENKPLVRFPLHRFDSRSMNANADQPVPFSLLETPL